MCWLTARVLPVNDPDDRELNISCGYARFNLRVAAAAANLESVIESLPDIIDPAGVIHEAASATFGRRSTS